MHNSPSGAIERVIYALLEKSDKLAKQGKIPYLPLWLMNTQIRLIPINSKFIENCVEINSYFKNNNIRVDIDDREESLSKRIREAEMEWIQYIVIIGEKEVTQNVLSVRDRLNKSSFESTKEELKDIIHSQIKNKPYLSINLPELISVRPKIMA